MSVNIQTDNGLKQIADKTTKKKIKEVLGYTPANEEELNSHKEDDVKHISSAERDKWNNQPHITNDQNKTLLIIDNNGNILAQFDSEGLHIIGVKIKGKDLLKLIEENGFSGDYNDLTNKPELFSGDYYELENRPSIDETNDGTLSIADENGHIAVKIDQNGIHSTEFSEKGIFLKDKYAAKDSVPTKTSELQNDSDYTTIEDVGEVLVGPAIDECKEYTDNSVNSLNGDNIKIGDGYDISIKEAIDSKLDSNEADKTYAKKEEGFSGNYNDLTNKPIETADSDKELHITDNAGNIIATIDLNGFHTTELHEGGFSLKDKYLQLDAADARYGTKQSVDDIELRLEYIEDDYVTSYHADNTYLTITNAGQIYLTKNSAASTYATKEEVSSLTGEDIYTDSNETSTIKNALDTIGSAVADKLDKTTAADTYAKKIELFSGKYDDLTDKPIETADSDKELYIVDGTGNILASFTREGINAANLQEKSINLSDKYATKDELENYPTINNVAYRITEALNGFGDYADDTYAAKDDVPTDYIKSLSINGKTITYTKGDGSTDTLTTKDTTYSQMTSGYLGLGKPANFYYQSTATYNGGSFGSSPCDTSSVQTIKINTVSNNADRYYGIEADKEGRLFVNVPWTGGSGGISQATMEQYVESALSDFYADKISSRNYYQHTISITALATGVKVNVVFTIIAKTSATFTMSSLYGLYGNKAFQASGLYNSSNVVSKIAITSSTQARFVYGASGSTSVETVTTLSDSVVAVM